MSSATVLPFTWFLYLPPLWLGIALRQGELDNGGGGFAGKEIGGGKRRGGRHMVGRLVFDCRILGVKVSGISIPFSGAFRNLLTKLSSILLNARVRNFDL